MANKVILINAEWPSQPQFVHEARAAVRSITAKLAPESADLIELALGEACANAIEHGSPNGANDKFIVRCGLQKDHRHLFIEVEDHGAKANNIPSPPGTLPDLEAEGGRGLFLMKHIMSNVSVTHTGHGLLVHMVAPCECIPDEPVGNLCSTVL